MRSTTGNSTDTVPHHHRFAARALACVLGLAGTVTSLALSQPNTCGQAAIFGPTAAAPMPPPPFGPNTDLHINDVQVGIPSTGASRHVLLNNYTDHALTLNVHNKTTAGYSRFWFPGQAGFWQVTRSRQVDSWSHLLIPGQSFIQHDVRVKPGTSLTQFLLEEFGGNPLDRAHFVMAGPIATKSKALTNLHLNVGNSPQLVIVLARTDALRARFTFHRPNKMDVPIEEKRARVFVVCLEEAVGSIAFRDLPDLPTQITLWCEKPDHTPRYC